MGLKKTKIIGFGGCIGYECKSKQIQVVKCPNGEADQIISAKHYSKRPAKYTSFSFKVIWMGAVHGALQIGIGIRPKQKGPFPYQTTKEFDRMWLSDEMPKFSETIVISCLIHYLQSETTVTHLISWADGSAGNVGTIYKASNFRLVKTRPVDFYEIDGERVHPLRLYHRHGTRAFGFLQKQYPSIKKLSGLQYQYVYEIPR